MGKGYAEGPAAEEADRRRAEPAAHLNRQGRQGDGDPGPPVEDLVEVRVARIVVIVLVAAESFLDEEMLDERDRRFLGREPLPLVHTVHAAVQAARRILIVKALSRRRNGAMAVFHHGAHGIRDIRQRTK